jgi:molybdopterin-guanine dinucleotide biosynthesis protein A
MVNSAKKIVGVVLAGGRSRRFGSTKAFAPLAGMTLIDHVIARATPQVSHLLLSADGDPRFAALGLPLVTDDVKEDDDTGAGPLAGILAALDWYAARVPEARWLATFAVDTPLLPHDMVERLHDAAARGGAEIACGRTVGRLHPLQALWSMTLRDSLRAALATGERAVHRFAGQRRLAVVDFPVEPFDPFANVNTPADLERLAQLMR